MGDSSGAIVRREDGVGVPPVRLHLFCSVCGTQHIDEGEWATRVHKTHQCQSCGHEWRPADFPTVGVDGGITLVSDRPITLRRARTEERRHRIVRFCMCRSCKESVARHFAETKSFSELLAEQDRLEEYIVGSTLGLSRSWLRHLLETVSMAVDLREEADRHG